jgi:hypothetical protein
LFLRSFFTAAFSPALLRLRAPFDSVYAAKPPAAVTSAAPGSQTITEMLHSFCSAITVRYCVLETGMLAAMTTATGLLCIPSLSFLHIAAR